MHLWPDGPLNKGFKVLSFKTHLAGILLAWLIVMDHCYQQAFCSGWPLIAWWLLQENNFKAVLESIRDLMNEDTVMPDWLHDIFLGYGDPAQAKYTNMPADQLLQTIDFKVQSCLCPSIVACRPWT